MRKLMWLTLGFGAACALCAYVIPKEFFLYLLAAGLILALAGRKLPVIALVLLGLGMGFGWNWGYDNFYLNPVSSLESQAQYMTLRTSDYSYENAYGSRVDAVLEVEGKPYQVRAYLKETEAMEPGTSIHGTFRLRMTDSEDDTSYHSGKGIFLLAYQDGDISSSANEDFTLRERASILRKMIEGILEQTLPEDVLGFSKALLLGNTRDLSYKVDTDLKISGIRHVAAVSGLHVSILFALLSAVTLRRRYLKALLGFPLLLLFAAVAGFTPSVNRACIMSGIMLLSSLAQKEYDRPTALSFACLVMLMWNPLTITSVSFQLSVSSVAGICLFEAPIRKWLLSCVALPREKSWIKTVIVWIESSVSVTLSAMSLTMPLCAWYFGVVSLVSVLTNLLTLWIISFIFYGLVAICLCALLWRSGAILLGHMTAWLVRCVLAVAGSLAKFPLAAVYTESIYVSLWVVFVYVLLGIFLLSRNQKPKVLVCCGLIGLCCALLVSYLEPKKDAVRLTVLDVGQGQCLLLQSQGNHYLVDCGGDSDGSTADLAAHTLLSQGITRLDGMILTHLDRDHAGGASNLLNRIPTDLLILPPEYTEADFPAETVIYADRDLELCRNNSKLTVFCAEYPGNSNEKSLCILFDTEKCDILITGDRTDFGERMLLRYHTIPDVDVLIAGHHGAKSSSCEQLLQAAKPEIVCISVGRDNFYGHPHEDLLTRLREFGCTVYRTDENGTIRIRR